MVAKTLTTAYIVNGLLAVTTEPTPVERVEQMGAKQIELEKQQRQINDAQTKYNSHKWLVAEQPKHKQDVSHHSSSHHHGLRCR